MSLGLNYDIYAFDGFDHMMSLIFNFHMMNDDDINERML